MLPEAAQYKKEWQAAQQSRLDSGIEADSFVYLHVNADDGVPHYVGIGYRKARPWELDRNNKHRNKVEKHGLRVEIVADNLTWEQACFWEVHWIKALRAAGYELTNLTDGGDGLKGFQWTDEMRVAHSIRQSDPETVQLKSEKALKNWEDPEIRAKYEYAFSTPEYFENRSRASKEAANRPGSKELRSAVQKKAHNTPEVKTKQRLSAFECQNRPETKQRKSIAITQSLAKPEVKERHKTGSQRGWDNCTEEQYKARCKSMSDGILLAKIGRLEIIFWGS